MKFTIALISAAAAALAPFFLTPDTPAPAFVRTWTCPAGQLVIDPNGQAHYLAHGLPAAHGKAAGQGTAARLSLVNAPAPMPPSAMLRATANQLLIEGAAGESQLCRASMT